MAIIAESTPIPYIDPNIAYVGVSRLRKLNATNLRKNKQTLVIQDNETPLAVLLSYEQFLCMQNHMRAILETIEMLSDKEEVALALAGLNDVSEGKTELLSDIRDEVREQ